MKITKSKNHGKICWLVNDPNGPDGKRQRKFFDTREAADAYAKERTAETKAYGVHFTTIPQNERAAFLYQLERIRVLGWTLPDAVDFIEEHGKAAPSMPLGTVADEFLTAKNAAGLRPRYLKTFRASIHRFLLNRREKLIGDITPAEIQEYISSNGWVPSTMRSYRGIISTEPSRCTRAMKGAGISPAIRLMAGNALMKISAISAPVKSPRAVRMKARTPELSSAAISCAW